MKNFSLAMISFLMLSTVVIAETIPNTAQIYMQDFAVSVTKESEILVEPPIVEVVNLTLDELTSSHTDSESQSLGIINIETTANSCFATITTQNNFTLAGATNGDTLASYQLEYIATGDGNNAENTVFFTSNNMGEQSVGCQSIDLKLHVSNNVDSTVSADAYTDVIHVEVRAES